MKLVCLVSGPYWDVAARADGEPPSVLRQILTHANKKQQVALNNLFRRMAEQGQAGLTRQMFSKACNDRPFVYKFRKQQLRVYCFMDEANRRVVLSHAIMKKSQATAQEDLQQCRALEEKYHQCLAAGSLKYQECEDDQ